MHQVAVLLGKSVIATPAVPDQIVDQWVFDFNRQAAERHLHYRACKGNPIDPNTDPENYLDQLAASLS